jgi:hypothetical protein
MEQICDFFEPEIDSERILFSPEKILSSALLEKIFSFPEEFIFPAFYPQKGFLRHE